MSKLLLDEHPLIILPSLAVKIGLNESIILQQMNYWLNKTKHIIDGIPWIYNSYPEWQKQLPFWSEKTIKRTITKLENEGYILSGNFNKLSFDKTKWYTIDYQKLDSVPTIGSNCPDDKPNLSPPIPEITTETSSINKINYAAYVSMKESEYKKLVEQYGEERTHLMIEILDNYKGAHGKKYKDDYKAILTWAKDEALKRNPLPKQHKEVPELEPFDYLNEEWS